MKTNKIGPLYAKASTGKIKEWQITAVEEGNRVVLNTMTGYVNGKKTTATKDIKGKNIGKKNETSPWEQAILTAQSKERKKRDEGYFDTIEEAENTTVILPMLALVYQDRKHNIEWPAYVQPKLNGVRCTTAMTEDDPTYTSRKGKPYETLIHLNDDVEKLLCNVEGSGDGEIYKHGWTFQEIIRAVKKHRPGISEQLEYWIYDIVNPSLDFEDRLAKLQRFTYYDKIRIVPTYLVNNEEEMMAKHKEFTADGYEGTIVRNRKGKYELSHRSKNLQKYKDFKDEEFEIVGGEEATGEDRGTVVFVCRTDGGSTFRVRPKGSRDLRRAWLSDINSIIGKQLTVKFQEKSEDGIPIFPVGLAVRDYEG